MAITWKVTVSSLDLWSSPTAVHFADCADGCDRSLAGYIYAVARAVGVPLGGVVYEDAESRSAYLALARRCLAFPDRELMLLWDEVTGWSIALEAAPTERPTTLARLAGDAIPVPQTVATFVDDVLSMDTSSVRIPCGWTPDH